MRIGLVADYYTDYISAFQRANQQELEALAFDVHRDRLFDDYFGSFISYRNHFRKSGHQAELFVANYYGLQQKWLRQMGINMLANADTKHEVLLHQLREFRPDVVFAGSMFDYYGQFFQKLRTITPNIFTWISCPMPPSLDFSNVRCVISSIHEYVNKFRKQGLNSEWLRAAFDPDILSKIKDVKNDVPLSFVGAMVRGVHESRVAALEYLLKRGIPVQLWGSYSYSGRCAALKGLFVRSPLQKLAQAPVWGLEMYRTLARSHITLNPHGDIAKLNHMSGNMRLYEGTGCGALVITDDTPDVGELFRPDLEVVVYRTREELADKIKYYLDQPAKAAQIAEAGKVACLAHHSYPKRIAQFSEILFRHAV
jgi:spore maturation protein CgeB